MLQKDTRIGIFAPITWPIPPIGYGPWEQVVTNLATGLVATGYNNVTVIATKQADIPGAKTEAVIEKPLLEPAPANDDELNEKHIRHAFEFAKGNLDIIHNHFNYHPLDLFSTLSIPVVSTMHGSGVEKNASVGYLRHKDLAYISISDAERNFVPELNYVATVYNGIDFNKFVFGPTCEPYLVNVGRIHPTKGVHNAVELARLLDRPLKIAGKIEPSQQAYFDQKIKPFLNEKIEYLGPIKQSEVIKLIGNATAAVGLIEWEEPFGLSVAEAMACGTPVIATPRGAHREIITDGITGILVDNVSQAVSRFDELLKIDRKKCHAIAKERFSIEAMTAGYLQAYEHLLNR